MLKSVLKSIFMYLNDRHDVGTPPLNICIHVDSLLKDERPSSLLCFVVPFAVVERQSMILTA